MTVTAVTALGAISILIASPAALSVPVDTNGWVFRVVTSGTDATCDESKFTLTVTDPGYNAAGTAVTQTRTIYATGHLRKPWGDYLQPSTSAGTFDLTLSERIYAGSTVTAVQFGAGFTSGSALQNFTAGSVTRSDSLPYFKCIARTPTAPFELITSANSRSIEVMGGSWYARNGGEFACVEAWYRQGTTDFALARSSTMVASASTPASGTSTSVSGVVAPVYRIPIDGSAATDGAGVVRYQVKPWIGDSMMVWQSWVEGEAFPTLNSIAELPMIRDYAGKFQGAYAYVNQSGVAGASPAVQTTMTDPGSAGSYASRATALAALRVFNNARTGGLAHDDVSGGAIVYREVAGSTRGSDTNAYIDAGTSIGSLTTYPIHANGVPFEVRSPTGLASDLVRLRGSGTAASKVVHPRMKWRGLTFDGNGVTTAANNIVLSGSSSGGTATTAPTAAAACTHIFIDCLVDETTAIVPGASVVLSSIGYRYDYRMTHNNCGSSSGVGASPAVYPGLVVSMGSKYYSDTVFIALVPTCIGGVSFVRGRMISQATTSFIQPRIKCLVMAGVRFDAESPGNTVVGFGDADVNWRYGLVMINVLVRCVGTTSAVGISFNADGSLGRVDNAIFHHVASFGAGTALGRMNMGYQDQGYVFVPKTISLIGVVANSFNNKSDGFPAGELPSASAALTNTAVAWLQGNVVHDGNATLASRLIYQAIQDVPIGTALTDTAYWYAAGAKWSVGYGAQSLRTGNWSGRNGVDSRGNVWTTSANGSAHTGVDFAPDNIPIDTLFGTGSSADYYRNAAIGTTATATDATNFVPKSLGIDGIDSPLLNRIRSGQQPVSIDLFGLTRRTDGTGAAGPLERQDIIASSGSRLLMGVGA